jgi:hypothetical protein
MCHLSIRKVRSSGRRKKRALGTSTLETVGVPSLSNRTIFNNIIRNSEDTVILSNENITLCFIRNIVSIPDLTPIISDTDSDGLWDRREMAYFSGRCIDFRTEDTDNDGIINILDQDSDNDSLLDGDEVDKYGTDPLNNDTDGEGLNDSDEINVYHTSPLKKDSDTDGMNDSEELNFWVSVVGSADRVISFTNQAGAKINLLTTYDSDSDGMNDGEERTFWDSIRSGLCKEDSDNDGYVNILDKDSDNDGITDNTERLYFIGRYAENPILENNYDGDYDGDGLINILDPDSDNDYWLDSDEIYKYKTDPINEDTDSDFIIDSKDPEPLKFNSDEINTIIPDAVVKDRSLNVSIAMDYMEEDKTKPTITSFTPNTTGYENVTSPNGSIGKFIDISTASTSNFSAIVRMRYSETELAGANESDLGIYYWDNYSNRWMPESMDITIDTENDIVWTETNHMSAWNIIDSMKADSDEDGIPDARERLIGRYFYEAEDLKTTYPSITTALDPTATPHYGGKNNVVSGEMSSITISNKIIDGEYTFSLKARSLNTNTNLKITVTDKDGTKTKEWTTIAQSYDWYEVPELNIVKDKSVVFSVTITGSGAQLYTDGYVLIPTDIRNFPGTTALAFPAGVDTSMIDADVPGNLFSGDIKSAIINIEHGYLKTITSTDAREVKYPATVLDSSNALWIVWQDKRYGNYEIYYKKLKSNGDVAIDEMRLTTTTTHSIYPTATVDEDNSLHIAWMESATIDIGEGGTSDIFYAKISPQGTVIKRLQITPSGDAYSSEVPSIAVDKYRNVHIIWYEGTWWYESDLHYSKLDANNNVVINNILITTAAGRSATPRIKVGYELQQGQEVTYLHITWDEWGGGGYYSKIYYKVYINGGNNLVVEKTETRISSPSAHALSSLLAVDSSNKAHIAWQEFYYGTHIKYTRADSNIIHQLTTSGSALVQEMLIDKEDNLHMVWFEGGVTYYMKFKNVVTYDTSGNVIGSEIVKLIDKTPTTSPAETSHASRLALGDNMLAVSWIDETTTPNRIVTRAFLGGAIGTDITLTIVGTNVATMPSQTTPGLIGYDITAALQDYLGATDISGNLLHTDTDGDGLNDGAEVEERTIKVNGADVKITSDPNKLDADGDGLWDGWGDRKFYVIKEPAELPEKPSLYNEILLTIYGSNTITISPLYAETLFMIYADTVSRETAYFYTIKDEKLEFIGSIPAELIVSRVKECKQKTFHGEAGLLGTTFGPTNPKNVDTDGDGLYDGDEAYPRPLVPPRDETWVEKDGWKSSDGHYGYYYINTVTFKTNPTLSDSDGDGLYDGDEQFPTDINMNKDAISTSYVTNPTTVDGDGDGLWDGRTRTIDGVVHGGELSIWTSPNDKDTDDDGLPDGWIDYDKDGATDLGEYEDRDLDGEIDSGAWNGGKGPGETDPTTSDSDGDGRSDGVEVEGWQIRVDINGDGDTVDIGEIYNAHTDPLNSNNDVDGDGLNDETENTKGTDPNKADTDKDGLWDGQTVTISGVTYIGETSKNTEPLKADTELDGMPDGWEVRYNLKPTIDDSKGDADNDGVVNLMEYRLGSDPTVNQFSTTPGKIYKTLLVFGGSGYYYVGGGVDVLIDADDLLGLTNDLPTAPTMWVTLTVGVGMGVGVDCGLLFMPVENRNDDPDLDVAFSAGASYYFIGAQISIDSGGIGGGITGTYPIKYSGEKIGVFAGVTFQVWKSDPGGG